MLMRVSKDKQDQAYSETADRRRVWCRDVEILDWITADEFRRVVIDATGKAHNGGVRVERLPEDSPPPEEPVRTAPIDAGFAGAGMVYVPDTPVTAPVEVQQQEQVLVHPDAAPVEVTTGFLQVDSYVPAPPVMAFVDSPMDSSDEDLV